MFSKEDVRVCVCSVYAVYDTYVNTYTIYSL